jgi:hypothetical protein
MTVASTIFASATVFADDRGDRYRRHDDREHGHGRYHDRHTDVRVDINLGRSFYEERVTRVWVEPVYRTVCDRVWIEPVHKTVCDRVWVPDRWEVRRVVHGHGRHQCVRYERVLVERGHYETRERSVLVCDGRWETVERQELVTPGHWEERVEHVRVDRHERHGDVVFDLFAHLRR